MELEKEIIKIAEKMDLDFWEGWRSQTQSFPDVENGWETQLLVVQIAVATIISKYLLGFQRSFRAEKLEELVRDFRAIEMSMRDIE